MKDNHKISELKILIAEDDEISGMLLSLMVKSFGEIVLRARNGVEAVAVSRKNLDIDLILMDIQMPELNGLEVCRQMRLIEQSLQRPKCGIILHTADSRPEIIVMATKSGVDYCLFKPYTQTQLLQAMGLSLAINRPNSGPGSGAGAEFGVELGVDSEPVSETESGLILDSESEPNTPIRLANDPSLEALKGAFFQQTTTHLQQCVHHLETHTMSDIPALLHQLIGSTSLFGAHELHATLTQINVIVNSLEEAGVLKVEDSLEVQDSGEDTDSVENKKKWAEHLAKPMNNAELERLMLLAQQQLKAYESHG